MRIGDCVAIVQRQQFKIIKGLSENALSSFANIWFTEIAGAGLLGRTIFVFNL
jgi:hypothetical protein